MTNLVRGGVILLLTGLFFAVVYGTTGTEFALNSANDSQIDSSIITANIAGTVETEVVIDEEAAEQGQDQDKNKKKIIEKTVSSKAAGVSRGRFTATAYCLRGRTALGHGVRRGIIAADPRVLPLGSRISISGAYSGTYLVSDTGGKVKGKRLDIWMPSCAEARRFGRRSVSVMYLGR
ncbi:MAG: 3D domain-containing protein [Pyrinomonadaceae bacterium]